MTGTDLTSRKRLHVITWGCQMNVYDSGRMSDVLAPLGYAASDTPEGADMVILNTCHIRDKAAEKVFSELGRLRRLKEATGGRMILAVAGCVAQAEGKEILSRAPYVDIVLGPQTYHRLPEMVAQASRAGGAVIETDFPAEDKFDHLPEQSAPQGVTAFLTVQEGCDKFCSFCVVPYTRGAEQSRPAVGILAEARRLIAQGSREITLLGQNVNAWRGGAPDGGTWGLGALLRAMAALPGLFRLRYATSHPRDMDAALIEAHRDLPALMPFLHLPVQSGSDRILTAMNRKHTADDYLRLVDRLRAARPDLALSSDFIVGHPGETDADFEATLELVRSSGSLRRTASSIHRGRGRRLQARPDRCRRLRKIAACKCCKRCCANNKVSSTRPVTGPLWMCCSPVLAGTLVRSLDGHNIFNPFTSPDLSASSARNGRCESVTFIQIRCREPLSRRA